VNFIMAKQRYVGDYPVIGICPMVDGRRGPMQLRESMEEQVVACERRKEII
jgi:L-fucose isomerase